MHDNVSNAALVLTSSNSMCENLVEVKSQGHFSTPSHCLEELSTQFIKEKEKLKIDFDDILNDGFAYHKDPGFDPKKFLKIQIRVQPAADTGGISPTVLHNFT